MKINDIKEFKSILKSNENLIIIKLGAKWCKPCSMIESHVEKWFKKMPKDIHYILVDIDESPEVYSFLRNKKMITGIPTLLMYKENNDSYVFDDSVNGTNEDEINLFFERCLRTFSKSA